jgi:predicted alpha/beta superfamily hydrolase
MKRVVLTIVCLCLTVASAGAGEPITIGEIVTIQSEIMGEERTVLISTPRGYDGTNGTYPVLYLTDGYGHFSHTRGTADFLVNNGLAPQLIIVAVTNTDRTRDLTPTQDDLTTDDGEIREMPTSGGAERFLDFFEKELFPYIDSHYRTQPLRLFSGHSFGGLFALNAFFTRPEMFDAILAISPSLRWDDELPIRQAKSFKSKGSESPPTLFVAMANEEEGDPQPNRLDRLEKNLSAADRDNFDWQVMRMPDETHGSVVLRAHYWGLRFVFEPWRLPADPETGRFVGGLAELKQHYQGLSKRYGYNLVPAEQNVNIIAYQVMGRDEVDEAIAIFEYNVELYPSSANVYDSLGDGLSAAGRLDEAYASYSKAVENGSKTGDENLAIYTANRDRVKEQLEQTKNK